MKSTNRRYIASLRYLWILLAMPLVAGTARIYVLNNAGDTVDVVDPATNKVVQVIEGIEVPHGVDFAPDGSRAYITNVSEEVLNVVDTRTGKTIKKVPLSGEPNLPAVTKDGGRVFICIRANPPLAGVDVVDTTSLEKIKSIPMKAGMHDIYMTPDGKYAVAGSVSGKFATVIDLQTYQPAWDVKFDGGVLTMAVEGNPDGSTRRIFVQLQGLRGFAVVDFAKRAEVGRIQFPDKPSGFPAPNPSHGSGVAPDGKTFWIDNASANSVFVYSLPDLKLLGYVPMPELKLPGGRILGVSPEWVTFTPDSKTAYIATPDTDTVTAIDVKTLKVVATIAAGQRPNAIGTLVLP